MTNILIVESVDDWASRDRHKTLMESPWLVDYKFSFCYALHSNGQAAIEDLLDLLVANPPTEEKLGEILRQAILKVDPHFVLLHTGFVFHRSPEIFYTVFRRLRQEFPRIGFGYQERDGLRVDPKAFDRNAEPMQNLFFNRLVLGL